ncbi:MAG: prevent-host-death protein [Nitrospinae bacterium]|nr:prevent-host-death protein [Nitrospinota bacterium]
MKIYTYSQARDKLADVLDESRKEEVVIRRRKGDMYLITPKARQESSPFEVNGLSGHKVSRKDILGALRESRRR